MKQIGACLCAGLFLAVCIGALIFPETITYLKAIASENNTLGYIGFVMLLVVATVVAPVTVMPLIPMFAMVFGPLPTALLSIIGWSLGASLAFYIARTVGRPLLSRFCSLQHIDNYAARIPQRHQFVYIIFLRMCTPVDIGSYALGLVTAVQFKVYFPATVVGVSWFSFAFSYLGEAFITGKVYLLVVIGSASLVLGIASWYKVRQTS